MKPDQLLAEQDSSSTGKADANRESSESAEQSSSIADSDAATIDEGAAEHVTPYATDHDERHLDVTRNEADAAQVGKTNDPDASLVTATEKTDRNSALVPSTALAEYAEMAHVADGASTGDADTAIGTLPPAAAVTVRAISHDDKHTAQGFADDATETAPNAKDPTGAVSTTEEIDSVNSSLVPSGFPEA